MVFGSDGVALHSFYRCPAPHLLPGCVQLTRALCPDGIVCHREGHWFSFVFTSAQLPDIDSYLAALQHLNVVSKVESRSRSAPYLSRNQIRFEVNRKSEGKLGRRS
jgi:hypothetical protein